jgi:hypothetical protein
MAQMWRSQGREIYQSWIAAIRDEAEEKLSDWERGFVDSLDEQLDGGRDLSERQAQSLERIYSEKTS